ncbi:purple acid phosphatase family protein [Leekyejoonella antrihumi]|uniref:Metallophosphoesterase family protein n=1 Tax=Leekyejoonella antrihumi TaxID=1660198 RepID=A0A563E7R6_9MICO|nr:metallophosphoesterase family protein [Leekyejoonella antrihumi]TWP38570.1 metallophosphoesterase family protein [Leekyejoonella antrihumi]
MTPAPDTTIASGLSRRRLLFGAGFVAAVAALGTPEAEAAERTASAAANGRAPHADPPVDGLHLQFGADAGTEMVVSWHTRTPVQRARVLLGDTHGRFERTVGATTRSYVDEQSGTRVYTHHAHLTRLRARAGYLYAAVHEGAAPQFGEFRTGPHGRARVTFTSFGDQGTPTVGKQASQGGKATWVNDNLGSLAAGDTTGGVELVAPMFHLFNGDLCYANLSTDRVRTWWDFWANSTRSARNRPWMPSPGDHENELGNGTIGYAAYQAYFSVPPSAGQTALTRGLWYSFKIGGVRVISIANGDICDRDGGGSDERGYSKGAQHAWLEAQLRAARADHGIDWIVVCMHQVAISAASDFNGADLEERQEWMPLLDRYAVDLVIGGGTSAPAYGFAAFEVDPGRPGHDTIMSVTYYNVTEVGGGLEVADTFTLRRPRSDTRSRPDSPTGAERGGMPCGLTR